MTKRSNINIASEAEAPVLASHWLIVAVTLTVATLALIPTVLLLWPNGNGYSHTPLVLPLVAWLVIRQRHAIAGMDQRPCKPAFVVLAGLLFGWAWAFAANIAVGAEALWPPILICSVLAASGWRAASTITVPVLLLYSAIPIWDVINPLLQYLTTNAVAVVLNIASVPAFIQGNFVQIPAGVFEIASGCSGLNFFIVAITLAAVYSYLYYGRAGSAAALLVIAAAMAIVMNWVRVGSIIVLGHLTEMQSPMIDDHYTLGWVLFAIMLVPFFYIARRLEISAKYEPAQEAVSNLPTRGRPVPSVLVLLLLAMPILVWGRLVSNEAVDTVIELPEIDAWQRNTAPSVWHPIFPSPDGEVLSAYSRNGQRLDVYANWYRTQSQGRELIGYSTNLGGNNARISYDKPVVEIDLESESKSLEIHEIMVDYPNGERRLVWYHFLIGGESRSRSIAAQLRLGLLAIIASEQSGAVALSSICDDGDCDEARALLADEFATFNTALTDALIASTAN